MYHLLFKLPSYDFIAGVLFDCCHLRTAVFVVLSARYNGTSFTMEIPLDLACNQLS